MFKFIFSFLLLVLCFPDASAQVFWQEDFANGIPETWTNEDKSSVGLIWTYCADTTLYGNDQDMQPTCPYNWDDVFNDFQGKFESDTPKNGFASCVVDPFIPEVYTTQFDSRLTTDAINCESKDEVYLTFNAHIGVFRQNASTNAEINVSLDGINWTTSKPFPNLLASDMNTQIGTLRWSRNPEKIRIDISSIAANQPQVFIQWKWKGLDEYHWSIDDIKLTTESPFPDVDLTLAPSTEFHAIMPNYQTPVSQTEPTYFLTDIANMGTEKANDIIVIARVTNESETQILFEEKVLINELLPDQIVEDVLFPPYDHSAGIGNFKVIYAVESDEDLMLENNTYKYPFVISEKDFHKNLDTDKTVNLYPTGLNTNGTIEPSWGIANYYHVPNGNGFYVDEVIFEIPNRLESTTEGIEYVINDPEIEVIVNFYKWDDKNEINVASFSEYKSLGNALFTVTGGDGNTPNRIKLENVDGSGNIPLEDDQEYFVAIQYATTAINKLFAIKANTRLNYDPMIQATLLNNKPHFAAMAKEGNDNDFNTFAFGGDVIPHIGFTITENPTSTSIILNENALTIYPNPVQNTASVQFDFNIPEDAQLSILSNNGQVLQSYPLNRGLYQIDIDCTNLGNGTYILYLESNTLSAYKKLVVIH